MPPKPRLILHPGFHRSGCRSVQDFLAVNRTALPDLHIVLPRQVRAVTALCHQFSKFADPVALADIPGALATALAPSTGTNTDIIISAEDLCGTMPGIRSVQTYAALPAILNQVHAALALQFPDHAITCALTTRAREPWIFSLYRHHLAQRRLILKRSEFETLFQRAGDLDHWVDLVRAALPNGDVRSLRIEDIARHPLGPGGAILGLVGHPDRPGLRPVAIANAGAAPDLWPQLYKLNRRKQPDAELLHAKAALAGGATPPRRRRARQTPLEPDATDR